MIVLFHHTVPMSMFMMLDLGSIMIHRLSTIYLFVLTASIRYCKYLISIHSSIPSEVGTVPDKPRFLIKIPRLRRVLPHYIPLHRFSQHLPQLEVTSIEQCAENKVSEIVPYQFSKHPTPSLTNTIRQFLQLPVVCDFNTQLDHIRSLFFST